MSASSQIDQEQALFINSTVNNLYEFILSIPGSHMVINYIKTSYHNDPFRIALELLLVFFALKYMFSKKYKPHDNAVKLTRKVSLFFLGVMSKSNGHLDFFGRYIMQTFLTC
jgi:serine palmitoyltransferase